MIPLDFGASAGNTLQLLVGGGEGQPELLLVLDRPDANGLVQVRSWTSEDWSAPPATTERAAVDLLRDVESWARQRRRLTHPVMVVRQWLEG